MRRWGIPVWLGLTLTAAQAQPPRLWQGEWGAFTGLHADQGRRLSIHDCSVTGCRFSISARAGSDHAETASERALTFQSAGSALAILPGDAGKPPCRLEFTREDAAKPAIQVRAEGETCTSYYATSPNVSFSGDYPMRATAPYAGRHAAECFLDNSPARLATCTHPTLAKQEETWFDLAYDYPLYPLPDGKQTFTWVEQQNDRILQACDAAPDPAHCLSQRYAADIAAMQSQKDAYLSGTTRRGDPEAGGRLARQIAGAYRHSFRNGDVQGDAYTSTDTLIITPVGNASIHFSVELNFYNGHECSLSGGALFRQDGSFVFDDKPDNAAPDAPLCRLAIIPTATGVRFKDITGACQAYCGARGGWNGAGFTFMERIRRP